MDIDSWVLRVGRSLVVGIPGTVGLYGNRTFEMGSFEQGWTLLKNERRALHRGGRWFDKWEVVHRSGSRGFWVSEFYGRVVEVRAGVFSAQLG